LQQLVAFSHKEGEGPWIGFQPPANFLKLSPRHAIAGELLIKVSEPVLIPGGIAHANCHILGIDTDKPLQVNLWQWIFRLDAARQDQEASQRQPSL